MKKIQNTNKTAMKVSTGLIAASVAAAAAGYYFYGSTKAKTHRKLAAKWATHMKDEIIREARNLKRIDPKSIAAVVDQVAKKYEATRSASADDLKRATKELKANWKVLELETKRTIRKTAAKRTT